MIRCRQKVVDKKTGKNRRCKNQSNQTFCWIHDKSQLGGYRGRLGKSRRKSRSKKGRSEREKAARREERRQIRTRVERKYGSRIKESSTKDLVAMYSRYQKKLKTGINFTEIREVLNQIDDEFLERNNEIINLMQDWIKDKMKQNDKQTIISTWNNLCSEEWSILNSLRLKGFAIALCGRDNIDVNYDDKSDLCRKIGGFITIMSKTGIHPNNLQNVIECK